MASRGRIRTPRGQTGAFVLPVLDFAGVRHDLEQFGIDAALENWHNPTSQFVEELYSAAVKHLLDLGPEELRCEEMSLDAGPMHIQGVGNLRFLRLCSKVCDLIGVDDFTITDLTRLDPERTYRFACAFVNFVRYLEKRLQRHHPGLRESESVLASTAATSQEIGDSAAKLAALKEQTPNIETEIQEQVSVQTGLRTQVVAKLAQLRSLEEELAQRVHKEGQLEERYKEQQEELATNQALARDLEDQVVQSPNRLKQAIAEISEKVEHEGQKKEAICYKKSLLKNDQLLIEKVEKRLNKKLRLVGLVKEKIQGANTVWKSLSATITTLEERRQIAERLKQDEAELRRMLEAIAEKKEESRARLSALRVTAETDLANRKNHSQTEKERMEKLTAQHIAMEEEVETLEETSAGLDELIVAVGEQLEMLAQTLGKTFTQYRSSLKVEMGKVDLHQNYRRGVLPRKLNQSLTQSADDE